MRLWRSSAPAPMPRGWRPSASVSPGGTSPIPGQSRRPRRLRRRSPQRRHGRHPQTGFRNQRAGQRRWHDHAARHGPPSRRRTVRGDSSPDAFASDVTLTEHTQVHPNPHDDPYTLTKIKAFHETMRRVEDGQDIVIVLPGASFGPSPMGRRTVEIPGGNQRICRALRGEPARYLPMVVPWSCITDVAAVCLAALERGVSGERYLGLGAPDCVMSISQFVNRAKEIAGVDNRVEEIGRGRPRRPRPDRAVRAHAHGPCPPAAPPPSHLRRHRDVAGPRLSVRLGRPTAHRDGGVDGCQRPGPAPTRSRLEEFACPGLAVAA